MTMRKKLLITIACLSVILCTLVTGTIAWLIDDTQTITNTFTPSNITVELEETGTNADNKQQFQMIPGKTYAKNPTVIVTNDIDSYVFVEVVETNNTWNSKQVVTYSMGTGWNSLGNGVYYREVSATATEKRFSVLNGDQVVINSDLTKEYMSGLTADTLYPKLTFTAFAIQKADGGAENGGNFTPAEAWAEINK